MTSFKRSHECPATLSAPNPAAGHHQPIPPLETPRYPQASLGQSLVGSLLLSPGSWCKRFCLCPPRVYFPVLCKFWQLYSGVNGDLLRGDLCHTHTQSACPCSRPQPTRISSGDAQTQFCLCLCGVPGSWCAQDLFEPSEHLWQKQGLILNSNFREFLEIDSWRAQQKLVHQDPRERNSVPTGDLPVGVQESLEKAWVGGDLLQGWGHRP